MRLGALEAKIRIERDEPNAKFLLYAPTEEPDYEDDWLLDIRLYSRSFRADRAVHPAARVGAGESAPASAPLPTAGSSSTPRNGFRRSRSWSPLTTPPPTWTAR